MDDLHDFGTGLRAHLGLEEEELSPPATAAEPPAEAAVAAVEDDVEEHSALDEGSTLEILISFEHELLERERDLARREQRLAARAGSLLAAAQSLHDEVLGSSRPPDELARLRRRKSGAA